MNESKQQSGFSVQNSSLARILIVDDELPQMKALCNTLRDQGYETTGFTAPQNALAHLRDNSFELLLVDLSMPEMDGIALLRAALEIDPNLVGVIMTGQGTIDTAVEAMKSGALDYILKPFKVSAILPVLTRALAIRRLRLENVELERCVRQRSAELERANLELEAFSYSVSHDLRAPLRAIDGFANLLQSRFADKLPPDAQRYLNQIDRSAKEMAGLIDDLLRLSQISRQPLMKKRVDVSAMVRAVTEELMMAQGNRKIQMRAGQLPECIADSPLLKQVFVNLLSNAFKFTRNKEASVEVGFQQLNSETVYFVRDNGAGFDMEYSKKLFAAFQRLHSSHDFEGTGIGLSIVQRIVGRHGGRVWAEGEVDKGATFYFSIPTEQ